MTTILHVSASISGNDSTSRALGDRLTQRLSDHHGAQVIERDLSTNDIPFIDGVRFEANLTAPEDRNTAQSELAQIGDELIEELRGADVVVISSPMYNFAVPATVKAWADLVARAGTTFRYAENGPEGLLTGRSAYIVSTSGGTPFGGEMDFTTTWLAFFVKFLGIEHKATFTAPAILGENAQETIAQTRREIDEYAI